MACTPLDIYSVMVCSFGLRLLQNGFVALLLSTVLDSSRICRSKKGKNRAWTGSFHTRLRQRGGGSRTRKDKHIAVDDDVADRECFPEDILRDYLNSGEPIDLDELLGSDVLAAKDGSSKGPEFTKASRMVNGVSFEHTFFIMAFFLTLRLFAGPSHDEPSP